MFQTSVMYQVDKVEMSTRKKKNLLNVFVEEIEFEGLAVTV